MGRNLGIESNYGEESLPIKSGLLFLERVVCRSVCGPFCSSGFYCLRDLSKQTGTLRTHLCETNVLEFELPHVSHVDACSGCDVDLVHLIPPSFHPHKNCHCTPISIRAITIDFDLLSDDRLIETQEIPRTADTASKRRPMLDVRGHISLLMSMLYTASFSCDEA